MFGEHGFRFFPGFYQHVIATMEEIEHPDGGFVDERLCALPNSCFYTRTSPEPADGNGPPQRRRVMVRGMPEAPGSASGASACTCSLHGC